MPRYHSDYWTETEITETHQSFASAYLVLRSYPSYHPVSKTFHVSIRCEVPINGKLNLDIVGHRQSNSIIDYITISPIPRDSLGFVMFYWVLAGLNLAHSSVLSRNRGSRYLLFLFTFVYYSTLDSGDYRRDCSRPAVACGVTRSQERGPIYKSIKRSASRTVEREKKSADLQAFYKLITDPFWGELNESSEEAVKKLIRSRKSGAVKRPGGSNSKFRCRLNKSKRLCRAVKKTEVISKFSVFRSIKYVHKTSLTHFRLFSAPLGFF